MKKRTNYPWLDEFCLQQVGATKDYKDEWGVFRYMIGGKMFLMEGKDKYHKPIITVKLDPDFGSFLRVQYKDIVPGYYSNKVHWNSLYLQGDVPDDVVKSMIKQSYQLVFTSLSKKVQKELVEIFGVNL